jgi:hypothetical protein
MTKSNDMPGDGTSPSKDDVVLASSSFPAPLSRRATAKKKDQRVKRALGALRRSAPWLRASDTIVARNFVRLEILAATAHERVRKDGAFDSAGFPTPAADFLRRISLALTKVGASLGLTPQARIELDNGGIKTVMLVQTHEETRQEMTARAQVMAAALQILDEQGVTLNLPQAEQAFIETTATTDDGEDGCE